MEVHFSNPLETNNTTKKKKEKKRKKKRRQSDDMQMVEAWPGEFGDKNL